MTAIGTDTFQRANQSGWGTASDGQTWQHISGNATAAISNNTGTLTANTTHDFWALGAEYGDMCVTCEVQITGGGDAGIAVRSTSNTNIYRLNVSSGGNPNLTKYVGGTQTSIASDPSLTYTLGSWVYLKMQIVGSQIMTKAWADGTAEPSTWGIVVTDTSITGVGYAGVNAYVPGSDVAAFRYFRAVDYQLSDSLQITDASSLASQPNATTNYYTFTDIDTVTDASLVALLDSVSELLTGSEQITIGQGTNVSDLLGATDGFASSLALTVLDTVTATDGSTTRAGYSCTDGQVSAETFTSSSSWFPLDLLIESDLFSFALASSFSDQMVCTDGSMGGVLTSSQDALTMLEVTQATGNVLEMELCSASDLLSEQLLFSESEGIVTQDVSQVTVMPILIESVVVGEITGITLTFVSLDSLLPTEQGQWGTTSLWTDQLSPLEFLNLTIVWLMSDLLVEGSQSLWGLTISDLITLSFTSSEVPSLVLTTTDGLSVIETEQVSGTVISTDLLASYESVMYASASVFSDGIALTENILNEITGGEQGAETLWDGSTVIGIMQEQAALTVFESLEQAWLISLSEMTSLVDASMSMGQTLITESLTLQDGLLSEEQGQATDGLTLLDISFMTPIMLYLFLDQLVIGEQSILSLQALTTESLGLIEGWQWGLQATEGDIFFPVETMILGYQWTTSDGLFFIAQERYEQQVVDEESILLVEEVGTGPLFLETLLLTVYESFLIVSPMSEGSLLGLLSSEGLALTQGGEDTLVVGESSAWSIAWHQGISLLVSDATSLTLAILASDEQINEETSMIALLVTDSLTVIIGEIVEATFTLQSDEGMGLVDATMMTLQWGSSESQGLAEGFSSQLTCFEITHLLLNESQQMIMSILFLESLLLQEQGQVTEQAFEQSTLSLLDLLLLTTEAVETEQFSLVEEGITSLFTRWLDTFQTSEEPLALTYALLDGFLLPIETMTIAVQTFYAVAGICLSGTVHAILSTGAIVGTTLLGAHPNTL
jgi:hypothetical protein